MADGGQRLLDVIDDPNALESFLGGLTADSELLPSAETVDNVVASLARSLDENEYEVDSPNETLFDTLDSSSNHLTDISRSYVPSDFGHVVQNDAFTSNLDGFSNGNNVIRGNLSSHHEQQTPIGTSGCDQFVGSSNITINSVISASSVSSVKTVTSNNIKQLSVSNCDPSKSTSNFVQAGQIQLTQNSVSSASNNLNFTFSQDLQHKHNVTVSASQNQLNQVTSLSSVSVEGQIQQNVPSNSTNNLISVVGSANENGVVGSLSDTSRSFQVVSNQQSGQIKAQNLPPNNNSSQNTSANNIQVTSGSSSVSNAPVTNDATASSATSNVSLSNSLCATSVIGSTASIQQAQQYITSTSTHQSTAVNQLVSGQTVSIPSMTVSAPQLIASTQGGLVAATAGQNILQQIQSASGGQSYIAMEQPTTAFITGHNPFGSANVALVATGGTPAYAVLPTTQQFLTNAIIPQSHTIQTLTKTANGAYFQTTGTPQLVATSNVNALQNVSVANATSDAMGSTIVKPKQPPQLLPKPLSQVNTTVTTSTSSMTTPPVTSVSSSTESSGGTGSQQTSLPATSTSTASTSVADGVVTQIIQQSQQQLSSGNTGTVALTPQQSFAIGNATGLGQVVVSQVGSLSTMTAPQQAQLAGTIVVNQYGQPMLLPTASTAQAGALQLILRQQPTQQQVLTIQAPTGAQATAQTNAQGKPIVRYVSQVPQVAQTSGYGLQQIQTPNGPAWVAVRYPQQSQASQYSQIQTESIVSPSTSIQSQINNAQPQLQIQTQQQQQVQIQLQQQQNQVIQQSQQQQQQQQQIQLQQTHMQNQQQVSNQLQMQAQQQQQQHQQQQQQLSLQSQNQQQIQMSNQQGQLSNAQQIHQQTQQNLQVQTTQSLSQTSMQMDTQSINATSQQNQYMNQQQQQQQPLRTQSNQTQTQPQQMRDTEQQQISVPDSSSEPPPPKKAKTKSKSSKKKVTLDLEQLLKQSGIMDEDLNDDMSFDFGFGSMDTQPNGLPPSPQIPPAQIPVINTTETPKKPSSKKSKSNAKKSPATPQPPPAPVTLPSPSAKTPKRKSPSKKKPAPPPTPPPPLPPPPPPIVTPSKSKSSKKKSGSANENQKSEPPTPKTASSKKNVPPKKISSLDTLLATIDAVAAAAGASNTALITISPSPPPPPAPSRKPTPSPKTKSRSKSSKAQAPPAPLPLPAKTEPPPPPISIPSSLPPPPVATYSQSYVSAPSISVSQPFLNNNNNTNSGIPSVSVAPSQTSSVASTQSINAPTSSPRVSTPNLTNGSTSVTTSNTGVTRVVQTIQLTPQNQQLLRNIQTQIQKLCALPKRSETEQSALQKLVVLQQQVIATGIPVPNPAHLNNLAQSVNVESISLPTPSATVPSSDNATASSSSNMSLDFPSETDASPSPVSSTVSTAVMTVLANSNLINSSKINSSKLPSASGSSPLPNTVPTAPASGGGGSSNGVIFVGSPSVSSTASPDSTSFEQTSLHQSNVANTPPITATPTLSSAGVVVSNVKAEQMGQLVASVSVASPEDIIKENTHGKGPFGIATSVPVSSAPSTSSVSVPFSQNHVPSSSSYMPSTYSMARSMVDDKKAEEQRLANLKAEEEKRARWKKEEFEMLLQRDQQYVVKPDYEVPFASQKDAVERLMKYHIYRDRNDMNFEEFDAEFGNNAGILLEKFSVMLSKYRNLLLKESMKEVGCPERVMLERMFVSEEKVRLEQDRMLVAHGDYLELPPPPDSWVPKIKEMVDKEMIDYEHQDPVVSQQVQSAIDSIIGCETDDTSNYLLEESDKIEYDAFGVPINSSGYAGLTSASSADIDEAVRSILT